MPLYLDHVVILVNDLHAAIADYRALGFNAFFGGEHTGGKTHNALIVFQDGTYLELLAPTDPALLKSVNAADRSSFLYMFQDGEGFGGCAFASDDLVSDTTAMQARGLDVQLRPPGGRARPDGQELRWRSAMIGDSMTPFFIQDETPRVLRVPNEPEKTTQPNGVLGAAGLHIQVSDLQAGLQRYQAIFGMEPTATQFTVRGVTLSLSAAPGDRLVAIALRAGVSRTLDPALTHQTHIELVP